MIKKDKKELRITGSITEIGSDLACIIHSVRECLEREIGRESAEDAVRECIRLSNLTTEELEKEADRLLDDIKSMFESLKKQKEEKTNEEKNS